MKQKYSIYLFNEEHPRGKMFNLTEAEIEQYQEDGWQDSPKGLTLPEDEPPELTEEQVSNSQPGDLVKLVESYGFIVMTPEQLKAEANKMASVALNIEKFDDQAIIAEAERRGLKKSEISSNKINQLFERFIENNEDLNKDELIYLGNNGYTLGLRSNMKEETMIAKLRLKIQEV